jgi:hypothetical protein
VNERGVTKMLHAAQMKKITFAFLCFILIASCSRPQPTTRSFQRADILGKWTHRDSHPVTQSTSGSYSVCVILKGDGTFEQTIVDGDSRTHQTSGTWTLDRSNIILKGLLSDDWDRTTNRATWTKMDADWWFVNWYGSEQRVALFGGLHPDPDSFAPWAKERN